MLTAQTATHLSLYVTLDEQDMARQAATLIAEEYREAIAQRGVFTLAVSGGKTPVPLFHLLGTPAWREVLDWSKIEVYWVDERCVRPDDENSNYRTVRQDLLNRVEATRYYRMRGEDVPEKAAQDYENLLLEHFSVQPGEAPRFDCVILGVGTDGHTGSLFLGDPAVRETKRMVMDAYPQGGQPRLTLTLPVLNNARCCIFLASGRAKNDILSTALNLMSAPLLPAQMVRPRNGKLCWIIDSNAYQG